MLRAIALLAAAGAAARAAVPNTNSEAVAAAPAAGVGSVVISQYNASVSVSTTDGSTPRTGRFVNGDWWVIGPVALEATSPAFDGSHNGFEINSDSIYQQGFDNRTHGFNASRVPRLPVMVAPGGRIVKAVSWPPGPRDHGVGLQTAIVVTVVEGAPPSDAFRPPYFGPAVLGPPGGYWRASDVDLSRMEADGIRGPADPSVIPTWAWMATRFERVQLDHLTNYASRSLHPTDNMPNYGANIAADTGDGAMRLMLPDAATNASALPARNAYLQMGLDIYGILHWGGSWPANGGHENGRKLPLALTGVVLGDANITSAAQKAAVADFSESDELVHHPAHASVVLFGEVNLDPEGTTEEEAYWALVTSGDGFRTGRDPYAFIDGGAYPSSYYQYCCTSEMWKGTQLPINVSAPIREAINLPFFSQYVNRWVSFGAWAQPDPCAPPTGTCSSDGSKCAGYLHSPCDGGAGKCDLSMAGYGKEFGPDGSGSCIKDTDPSDGTGRFPSLHGAARDAGDYESPFAAAMWKAQEA